MTRRLPSEPEVWQLVECPHCGAIRGVRCVGPNGETRDEGSHVARLRALWAFRRPRRRSRQVEMFDVVEQPGSRTVVTARIIARRSSSATAEQLDLVSRWRLGP